MFVIRYIQNFNSELVNFGSRKLYKFDKCGNMII